MVLLGEDGPWRRGVGRGRGRAGPAARRRDESSGFPGSDIGDDGVYVLEVVVCVADGDADEVRGRRVAEKHGEGEQHPPERLHTEGGPKSLCVRRCIVLPAPLDAATRPFLCVFSNFSFFRLETAGSYVLSSRTPDEKKGKTKQ